MTMGQPFRRLVLDNWQRHLPTERDSCVRELLAQSMLIHGCQQSGPAFAMRLDGQADDRPRNSRRHPLVRRSLCLGAFVVNIPFNPAAKNPASAFP